MKVSLQSRASSHRVLLIAVLAAFLAILPALAQSQTIGQSWRLAASAAGGGLEIAADLTGAEVISIDIAGPGIGVVHAESTVSPVWLPSSDLADASYRFEVQLVDAGTGVIVDRLAGFFTVKNGEVVVPGKREDRKIGGLLPGLAETLGRFVKSALDFLVPDAEAADLTASGSVPSVFFDDTEIGGTEWQIQGAQTYLDLNCDIEASSNLTIRDLQGGSRNVFAACSSSNNLNSLGVDTSGDLHFADNGMFFDRALKRLGINNTAPSYIIDAVGTSRIILRQSTAGAAKSVAMRVDGTAIDLHAQNSDLWIRADLPAPAHNISMLSSRVGIGTTSPLYKVSVNGDNSNRSTLHFTNTGTDVGGWLTSVSDNNFFVSSGAMWDTAAGGWVQKSPDGKAVMAGSGGSGYRIITRQDCAVGTVCLPSTRLTIDFTGKLTLGAGAYSDGASWFDASSREYKDNVRELSSAQAVEALEGLNPVTFSYKTNPEEQHVGFIAEDVPALVATGDRKGLSTMDIVAVLTKVVKEQQALIQEKDARIEKLERDNERIAEALEKLALRVAAIAGR